MQALADFAGLDWQRFPENAGRLKAMTTLLRLRRACQRQRVARYPALDKQLDEYPSVPFYSYDGQAFFI